jgi:hypothetical protein
VDVQQEGKKSHVFLLQAHTSHLCFIFLFVIGLPDPFLNQGNSLREGLMMIPASITLTTCRFTVTEESAKENVLAAIQDGSAKNAMFIFALMLTPTAFTIITRILRTNWL